MNQNKRMNGNHCKKDAFFVQFYIVILTKNNLKKIQHCAELRAKGDLTLNERMEMLTVHRESLNVQIKVLQEHMAKLDDKIDFYRHEIERTSLK